MAGVVKQKWSAVTLFTAILIPLLTGLFSAFLTAGDMKIYGTMNHPPLAPESWVFPVAWTILYTLMGLASFFVYTSDVAPKQKVKALTFYIVQLVMNMFWSTLFFTYGHYMIAFIWLVAMWILILLCAIDFYKIHKLAGVFMVILLCWTTFAAYLNLAIFIMSITPMPLAA